MHVIKWVFIYFSIDPSLWDIVYITKEVTPSLSKSPLNFNGGLVKLVITSLMQ